ncbi:MAG: amino acid adenylation domain-containing protein [Rhodanobacter sp.]|jgi:amino acid adenylation domain-containing protein/non-ribosomal peptide synthase protein (TIGR01720 family)
MNGQRGGGNSADAHFSCAHELIAQQARRTAQAPAVLDGSHSLSYGELERRSNQLAHELRRLGVVAETRVALYLERSVDMVVALLGVMKAGGAYVPLDTSCPSARLGYMLRESGAEVLLVHSQLQERLPSHGARRILLDQERPHVEQHTAAPLSRVVAPDNLASLFFISGSAGTPKGVMISHRALVGFLRAIAVKVAPSPSDVFAAIAPLSFDAAALELYLPLLIGARVWIGESEAAQNGVRLAAQLRTIGATVLQAPPATWRMLLAAGWQDSKLKALCGGEPPPADLAAQFALRDWPLHYMYGSTETTAWSTLERTVPQKSLSIGKPIGNTYFLVLDAYLQPVAAGEAGELCIGGASVARGYWNRPGLTADRFVADPSGGGVRIYRSGDRVRLLPDGKLEFIGRTDRQVKVRGHRIEPGEIEAALLACANVTHAIVTVREDGAKQQLVAYVAHDRSAQADGDELRAYVRSLLPEYMVPTAFVWMEPPSLAPNDKMDCEPLPALQENTESQSRQASGTTVQEQLVEIWREVLECERIGVEDDFFSLGGDSIQSIKVAARANRVGIKLAPHQILGHQTIASLAAAVEVAGAVGAEQGTVGGEVPLTPAQHGFFKTDPAHPHHYTQSMLLRCRQRLSPSALHRALRYLATHHDALRLRFDTGSAGWRQQHISPQAFEVPVECIDLSTLSPDAADAALANALGPIQHGLNIVDGPLLRAALFDLGQAQPQRLLLVIHRLVVDAASWGILIEDLERAYRQVIEGDVLALPAKTTSFKCWAQRLQEYAASADARRELTYWEALARSAPTDLPRDESAGNNAQYILQQVEIGLDATATHTLLNEVSAGQSTHINAVLLAALVEAFAAWTGERRLLIQSENHGRDGFLQDVDISRTVGCFVSTFPMLLEVSATRTLREAIQKVQEQLQCMPHRGAGFGVLRYLSDARELDGMPEPQVSFSYLGQIDHDILVPALFEFAWDTDGCKRASQGPQRQLIEVDAWVVGGCLKLRWHYSDAVYRRSTIETLAERFMSTLRAVVEGRIEQGDAKARTYTPADFPLAGLNQAALLKILNAVGSSHD